MTSAQSVDEVIAKVSAAAFGRPLVTNVLRGQVVEAIVAMALEPSWKWCAEDYSVWDFFRGDGKKLEVKQSAVRQSWTREGDAPSKCSFDIAARAGAWEGSRWLDRPGRHADLYVFAYHPVFGNDADHRNPDQWQFFVISTSRLPEIKRIGLAALWRLDEPVAFHDLNARVQAETTL